MVDNEVRYALPRVWVQFMGLPSYLCDYLIIWAVGSILGISKEVDMVFTRRFNICRFQVLVMNPNLIPAAVNVVIEDNLYELKFRVELNSNDSSLQLMDMDRRPEDGGADSRDEAEIGARSNGWGLAPKSSQAGQGGNSGGNSSLSGNGASWALPTFSLHMPLAGGDGGAAPVLGFAAVYG
jgi:hypothetical protein